MGIEGIKKEVTSKKRGAKVSPFSNLELEALSVGLAFVNLPLALGLLTISSIGDTIEENKNMKSTHMSDAWLKKVSEADGVSPEGLSFLSKRLEKNGFVSVADASKWLSMEEEVAKKAKEAKKKQSLKDAISESDGASSLLKRAKEESGSLLSFEGLSKGLDDGVGYAKSLFGVPTSEEKKKEGE